MKSFVVHETTDKLSICCSLLKLLTATYTYISQDYDTSFKICYSYSRIENCAINPITATSVFTCQILIRSSKTVSCHKIVNHSTLKRYSTVNRGNTRLF